MRANSVSTRKSWILSQAKWSLRTILFARTTSVLWSPACVRMINFHILVFVYFWCFWVIDSLISSLATYNLCIFRCLFALIYNRPQIYWMYMHTRLIRDKFCNIFFPINFIIIQSVCVSLSLRMCKSCVIDYFLILPTIIAAYIDCKPTRRLQWHRNMIFILTRSTLKCN